MQEKAITMERFKYYPLGKELKAQTSIARKQYHKLRDAYDSDKIIKKEKPRLENYGKSDLIYNTYYSFYKYYCGSKKFDNFSLESKHSFLANFLNGLNKFKVGFLFTSLKSL